MLIYPLVYMVIWTIPTAIRIYQATTGKAAPFGIGTVDKICFPASSSSKRSELIINCRLVSSSKALQMRSFMGSTNIHGICGAEFSGNQSRGNEEMYE